MAAIASASRSARAQRACTACPARTAPACWPSLHVPCDPGMHRVFGRPLRCRAPACAPSQPPVLLPRCCGRVCHASQLACPRTGCLTTPAPPWPSPQAP